MTTGWDNLLRAMRHGRLGIINSTRLDSVVFVDKKDPPPSWNKFMNDSWEELTSQQKKQALDIWNKLSEKTREDFLT